MHFGLSLVVDPTRNKSEQGVGDNRRERPTLIFGALFRRCHHSIVVQKMEEPTIDERKRWWLICYAITSMEKAKAACGQIADHCTDWDHPLFEPLALAVHTFYSRPFIKNFGVGTLEAGVVPKSQSGVHKWLTHFRSGAMAHTDATPDKIAGHPLNDVVYFIKDGDYGFSTLYPRTEPKSYVAASKHCSRMIDVFQSHLSFYYFRFRYLMPDTDGEHLLSLDPDTPLFLLDYVTPTNAIFHYKIE